MLKKIKKVIIISIVLAMASGVLSGCMIKKKDNSQNTTVESSQSESSVDSSVYSSNTSTISSESSVSSEVIFLEAWRVKSSDINVRKQPNANSDVSYILYYNEVISVLKDQTTSDGWLKLKDGGYVYSENLEKISPENSEKYSEYIIKERNASYIMTTDSINVREKPNANSDSIGNIANSTPLKLLAITNGNWGIIDYNNQRGYVSLEYCKDMTEDEYKKLNSSPEKASTNNLKKANLISSYTTDYSFSTSNRAYNVEKGAKMMNGMVIKPGATFNWCRDMGPCGKDEGFKGSKEYQNGELVDGYGGGICQINCTLCASVLTAEGAKFEIVERHKHPHAQSYVKYDYDATVSYPDCNFIFKNTNDFSVQIVTSTSSDENITISLYKVN